MDNVKYLVYKSGEIFSIYQNRFLIKHLSNNGYHRVQMGNSKKSIHRLVASCWIPNPDNKPEVNHKDGNKLNNHASNLEWVTRSENAIHGFVNGLIPLRNKRKYLADEVPMIRTDRESGMRIKDIAKKYNIGLSTVHNIVYRKKYFHV
jgi:hypothetical protein